MITCAFFFLFLFLACCHRVGLVFDSVTPAGVPLPSFVPLYLCDYVTMQKSPTRTFIGGAHLWLILHNGSPIISALTRSVI